MDVKVPAQAREMSALAILHLVQLLCFTSVIGGETEVDEVFVGSSKTGHGGSKTGDLCRG